MRVSGRVAVVTGGGSGIGAASARLLAKEGARVTILDIANAEGIAGEIRAQGGEATGIVCNVTTDAQVREAMDKVAADCGKIDVLINSAGAALRRPIGDQDEEGWDKVIDTNLKGVYLCSRHALPHYPEHGGSIIHVSSVAGVTGIRTRAAYCASKGGVVALTRNMALDYASRRIRVNCVCPGFVRTPFIAPLLADPQRVERLTAMHPLGRLGEPEDIANMVLFLASDESSWVTGQALVVDGGFAAGPGNEI